MVVPISYADIYHEYRTESTIDIRVVPTPDTVKHTRKY